MSKNLTCQFNNTQYQVQTKTKGYRLRQSKVTLCETFDGQVTLLSKGQILNYRTLEKGEKPIPVTDEKTISHVVEQAKQKNKSNNSVKTGNLPLIILGKKHLKTPLTSNFKETF